MHVIDGLGKLPKALSPRFFYDERGSELFERITRLPEYYLTETEKSLLRSNAGQISRLLPEGGITIIEPGSGNSEKAEILFDHLPEIIRYVPIEISGEHLEERCENLGGRYPAIEIIAIDADYMDPRISGEQIITDGFTPVIFFPGSSLGNYEPGEAQRVLEHFRALAGGDVWLLIGIDLKKDRKTLERAYNDSAGVTAAFNKNLIERMRNELGADIDPQDFEHRAIYNPDKGRIEIYLVAKRAFKVSISGYTFAFESGEPILTEYSHKYSVDEFYELASKAGFSPVKTFCDEGELFSVHLMKAE